MPESIADGGMADAERDILAELEKALGEHIALLLRWNRKLVLGDSQASSDADEDDHDCDFGAWYALNRHNRLIDQPAMRALATTHQQLHESAKRLLSAHDVDHEVDSAEFDMMALRAESFFAQLRRLERAFRTARSDVDPLTGTYNRQTMMGDLNAERERAIRTGVPTAIALVDLDHFKSVNDTYGHQAGDAVLVALADTLRTTLRSIDIPARMGGEEFAVLLPGEELQGAMILAERLRKGLEQNSVEYGGSKLSFTSSFGVSGLPSAKGLAEFDQDVAAQFDVLRNSENTDIPGILYSLADHALYDVKATGRNRCKQADFSTLSEFKDQLPSDI